MAPMGPLRSSAASKLALERGAQGLGYYYTLVPVLELLLALVRALAVVSVLALAPEPLQQQQQQLLLLLPPPQVRRRRQLQLVLLFLLGRVGWSGSLGLRAPGFFETSGFWGLGFGAEGLRLQVLGFRVASVVSGLLGFRFSDSKLVQLPKLEKPRPETLLCTRTRSLNT